MKKTILTLCLIVATIVATQAQTKGDWYVGTGDISNVAWTEWAVSPTVGYGVTDKMMVGRKNVYNTQRCVCRPKNRL